MIENGRRSIRQMISASVLPPTKVPNINSSLFVARPSASEVCAVFSISCSFGGEPCPNSRYWKDGSMNYTMPVDARLYLVLLARNGLLTILLYNKVSTDCVAP